jgi:hypothetical protein
MMPPASRSHYPRRKGIEYISKMMCSHTGSWDFNWLALFNPNIQSSSNAEFKSIRSQHRWQQQLRSAQEACVTL